MLQVVKDTLDIISESGINGIAYSDFFAIAAHLMHIESTTVILLGMALRIS